MSDSVNVIICSDTDFEQLIAEIYINGKYVALLSQEEGRDKLHIEFPGVAQNESAISRKVELATFFDALIQARNELIR